MVTGGLKKRYSILTYGALGDFFGQFRKEGWKQLYWLDESIELILYAITVHHGVKELAQCFLRKNDLPLFTDVKIIDWYEWSRNGYMFYVGEEEIFYSDIWKNYRDLEPKVAIKETQIKQSFPYPYIVFHPYGSRPEITLDEEDYRYLINQLCSKYKVIEIGSSNTRSQYLCSTCVVPAENCRCPRFPRDECYLFKRHTIGLQHPNFISLVNQISLADAVTICKNAVGYIGTDSVWMNFVAQFCNIPAVIILKEYSGTFGSFWNYLEVAFGSWAWKERIVRPFLYTGDIRRTTQQVLEVFFK